MIVTLKRRRGTASYASYIHVTLSMLRLAALQGHRAYVDWRDQPAGLYADGSSTIPGNMWEWCMEQPDLQECPARPDAIWTYEETSWRPHPEMYGHALDGAWEMPWNAQDSAAIAELKRVVPRFLKFKPHIIEKGSALFRKHHLFPQRTVAVSHRGTDKNLEMPIAPVQDFHSSIDAWCNETQPKTQLWVKTEEKKDALALREKYPQAVVMDDFFMTENHDKISDAVNPKSGHQKALDAAVTLYMLAQCKILIKNAGNLADLAAGLQAGDAENVICVTGTAKR